MPKKYKNKIIIHFINKMDTPTKSGLKDTSSGNIPSRIFIIPYRDRIHQKFFFSKHMTFILESDNIDYEILFIHQCDARQFNRGAMKNIGFITVKEKYPDDYKNITLIFHDIDTLPFHKIFNYITEPGIVKHYYGFTNALGGIVVINAGDFEKINGFPNYWGWGLEDTMLQRRCELHELEIDRSTFYPLGSPEILHLFDGMKRLVSREEPSKMLKESLDGLITLNNVQYTRDNESLNPVDNEYTWDSEGSSIYYINVTQFKTMVPYDQNNYHIYDLRESTNMITKPSINTTYTNQISISPDEWKQNIITNEDELRKNIVNINHSPQLHRRERTHKGMIGLGGIQ